jgi:type I restriction enzyme S subunit
MNDEITNIPKIRFKGYTEDWEERKLSDIADKAVDNRGKTPTISEDGNHPLLEVASLGNGAPDYSKVTKYLSDETFMAELRAYIKEGDILFSTVGSIGLVSLMDTNENAAIAQNIVAFRANEKYDSKFLYAMLSTKDNQHKAQRIVMGAVQPSIKVSQLVDVDYCVTENMEEQRKLGEYFLNLGNLIALHQRELDLLRKTKQTYLQKMFPKTGEDRPEIRFAGFTEPWDQRKLGEILKKDTVKNKDLEFHSKDIISVAQMKDATVVRDSSDEYMTTYNKIRFGNIAFEGHANKEFPNGRFVLNDFRDGIVSHIYDVYIFIEKVDANFMKKYINEPFVMRKILINATSNARMMNSLNSKEFLKQKFLLPSLKEQQKIGSFFKQLDDTITLHQHNLNALKEMKKSLLQQMFV